MHIKNILLKYLSYLNKQNSLLNLRESTIEEKNKTLELSYDHITTNKRKIQSNPRRSSVRRGMVLKSRESMSLTEEILPQVNTNAVVYVNL